MCGACCKAPMLNIDMKHLKRRRRKSADARFIAEHWTQISWAEALERNPFLRIAEARYKAECAARKTSPTRTVFYKCAAFKDGKCSVYAERPQVCSNYPWYTGRANYDEIFYSDECGYRIDAERAKVIRILEQWNRNRERSDRKAIEGKT